VAANTSINTTTHDRRESVYANVQTRLREFVRGRGLAPGERLPPERELARQLGVSRTSLRQALTALRVEGLVDVRHGDGIYLLRSVEDTVPPIAAEFGRANPELPALGEVRVGLEALGAKWAALRRGDDDLAAMVAGLRLMEQEIGDGEPGLQGDRAFHAAVLRGAHNEVLGQVLSAIADGAARMAEASLRRTGQPPRSLNAHRLIFDAIVTRESNLAQQLMHNHLEQTSEIAPLDRSNGS
jgi:GntR family transcriptional repressor for pyruvate dehydrogenase complex